jgi:hypothetical protein
MALPVRDLLAVGLGAALGLVMIAFPQLVVQMHTLGRQPRTPGPAGGDSDVDGKWLWVVRALGVGCLGIAAVIGAGLLGLL